MRYLDLDTLLCEDERVPCIFQCEGAELAFLDPSLQNTTDLPANSRLELPMWLATSFAKKNIVKVEFPKFYNSIMREELLADSSCVNMKDYSVYFFDFGRNLSSLIDDRDLLSTLRTAFIDNRYRDLLTTCFNG